ncbi:MAG: DUF2244 domain-containing protein [Hyphomonadaceae bacterium]|nr:DUF2244 domain-containing protein [Hyphomonadaceae bacterium]
MSPRWERVAEPPPERGPAIMDAMLTPHRSLNARTFLIVICAFSAMNAALAVFWAIQGAWPVLVFLVLDVALLTWAFRINFRAARMFERVRIDAESLQVTRAPARGRAVHWVVGATWARVEDRPDTVRIAAGGRAIHVGAFLSPPERGDFAAALRAALARARG